MILTSLKILSMICCKTDSLLENGTAIGMEIYVVYLIRVFEYLEYFDLKHPWDLQNPLQLTALTVPGRTDASGYSIKNTRKREYIPSNIQLLQYFTLERMAPSTTPLRPDRSFPRNSNLSTVGELRPCNPQ